MPDFKINVVVDPSGAVTGTKRVRDQLAKTTTSADKLRATLARAFAFTTLIAGFRATVGLLAGFEQQMSTVRAISGATETQFASLREEAKRLGITTRFSASQAAEGMVFLARAGFDTEQVLGTIGGTLKLAQSGALDLGSAADIASNVLQGFRLEVDQTGRVVDVLALAANSANTTVGQLGQGLKFVAPVAAGLGISIEETTAAMSALSNAGLQSTLAGTGLRRVLSELESPAKKTRVILAGLGLAADDVRVSEVGLTTALQRLAKAGVNTGQALEIFGDRGGPAFEVLSSSIGDVQRMNKALDNAAGTADEVSRVMDDNLNGAILATRSAIQGFIIELGEQGATGALRGLFVTITQVFRSLAENADIAIRALNTLVITLGVRLAAKAIPAAISAVRALNVAIASNPIGALALAITAAVAALYEFSDLLPVTADGVVTLGDVGTAAMEDIRNSANILLGFFQVMFPEIAALAESKFGDVNLSVEGVLRVVARTVDGIVGLWKGAFDALGEIFGDLPHAIELTFVTAFNNLTKNLTFFLNKIIEGVNRVREAVGKTPLELVEAFTITASKPAQDLGQRINESIANGIRNSTAAEDELNRVLARASEIARERLSADTLRELEGPSGTGPTDAAAAAGKPAGQRVDPEFQKVLKQLRDEGDLLQLTSRERERRQALLDIEDKLERSLSASETKQVEALLKQNRALADQAQILDSIRGPQEKYRADMEALVALEGKGALTAAQLTRERRALRIEFLASQTDLASGVERTFLKLQQDANDTATQIETLLSGAFRQAEDAFIEFTKTGKINFKSLTDSITEELQRLAFRAALANIGSALFSGGGGQQAKGGGGDTSGIIGTLGQIAASYFGSGAAAMAGGGSFDIGGNGGVDRNLLSVNGQPVARVSKGEKVTVSPNGSQRPVTVNFAVTTPDGRLSRETQGQLAARVAGVIARANVRDR